MASIKQFLTTGLLVGAMAATSSAMAQSITIGEDTILPTGTASIPVSYASEGTETVLGVTVVVDYDENNFTFAACTEGTGPAGVALNCADDGTAVTVGALSFTDPLPDINPIATIEFTYIGAANPPPDITSPLPFGAGTVCSNDIAEPVNCTQNAGQIIVSDVVATLTVGNAAFGDVEINTTSAAQNVLIENGTGGDIDPTTATLTGTNPGDFALTNGDCTNPLADGATCNLSATCTPTAAGAREATVELTSGAFMGTGTLTCTGTVPAVVIVGDAAFGDVEVDTTSPAQPVIVTNGTANPVDATAFTVGGTNAGDFTVTAGTCTATLAAGASCDLSATCTPSAVGNLMATVSLTGVTDTGTLTCNGTAAPMAIVIPSPEEVNLMMQGDSETVTLTNIGDAVANIGPFPEPPEGLTITENTCGAELAAGAECSFVVTFIGDEPTGRVELVIPGVDGVIAVIGGGAPVAIPTLSQWSMIIVGAMLAMLAMFGMRRKEG